MKKLLIILSMLLSTFIYAQEFQFKIHMEDKDIKVINFSSELGKTYSWDRCSGQTTQSLSIEGTNCEKVINSKSGFTGSVDVCVTATQEHLSDPYCFALCQGESVTWGNCHANVSLGEHLDIKNITNTDNRYVGTAEMLCTDGSWSIKSSHCEDNLAECGSDHNTINNNPALLCNIGTGTIAMDNGNTMNWNCATSANTVACLSYKVATCNNNVYQGCGVGTASAYTSSVGASTVTWNCTNGSSSVACSKAVTVATNGVCGSVNGTTVSSVPSSNLCASGTASVVVTNTTTHTWTCSGSVETNTQLGGTNSNCSANREPICSSGLTWNGSSCVGTQTQTATSTCPSGGSPSGSYCYSSYSYSAYGCPYGTSYSGGKCTGYEYEYMDSIKTCPTDYTYSEVDGTCEKDCYRGSTTCRFASPTFTCPSGWTTGYSCSRKVYVTKSLEYQGCNSGDSEGNGVCYSSYQVGTVSYTCPSGWTLSGTKCNKNVSELPIGYK